MSTVRALFIYLIANYLLLSNPVLCNFPPTVNTFQLDVTPVNTVPIINPTNPFTETPIIDPVSSTPSPPPPPLTFNDNPNTNFPPVTPVAGGGIGGGGGVGGGTWCVASQSASDTTLQVSLDYACGYGGADCSAIQPGGSCFDPDTVRDHASYAFNSYYQKNPVSTSCDFGGTAVVTSTDPSSQNCKYPVSSGTTSTSVPTTTTPAITNPADPPPTPTYGTGTVTPFSGSVPLPPDSSFSGSSAVHVPVACIYLLLLLLPVGIN